MNMTDHSYFPFTAHCLYFWNLYKTSEM